MRINEQENQEEIAIQELLDSIRSMAESQSRLVEIAQLILRETKKQGKAK